MSYWHEPSPVVAVIPGGGWLIDYTEPNGIRVTNPVLAWIFRADGTCQPVDVDGAGWSEDPREATNFAALHHPDSKET